MNDQLRPLSARIRTELVELARVLQRVEEGWQRAQRAADDYYLSALRCAGGRLLSQDDLCQSQSDPRLLAKG